VGGGLQGLPVSRQERRHAGIFYARLAAYGHFGRRDLDAPWERDDRADDLDRAARRHG
jgi:S-adenosylmethionine synthetase